MLKGFAGAALAAVVFAAGFAGGAVYESRGAAARLSDLQAERDADAKDFKRMFERQELFWQKQVGELITEVNELKAKLRER